MAVNIQKSLVLDRIRFFVYVPSKELFSYALSQLYEIAALKKQWVPQGQITVKSKYSKTRLTYCPQKKRCIASIELGATKNQKLYFRLDLLPTRFFGDEFEVFKEILGLLLDEFNYLKLYKTARISYLELAVDSLSRPIGSFLPFRVKTGSSMVYPLPDATGGIYLGSPSGRVHFCIYDKKRQIIEKLKETPQHSIQTRLEARIHSTGLSASELLASLKNPFVKLEVADLDVLNALPPVPGLGAFLAQSAQAGACVALNALSAYDRRKILSLLRKAMAKWWNPNKIWEKFPRSLQVIKP